MKLIAGETVAAVVHHLREDDGVHKPTGGAPTDKFLCRLGRQERKHPGWDLVKCPVPASPSEARKQNETLPSGLRWCAACLDQWEKMVQESSDKQT
jgi:hypothetical protein